MTGAAGGLSVGGCMPGNMKQIRPLCWYDLIAKGLGNSGLHAQTIEIPDGTVKRYSRPEDVTAATSAVAAPATTAPTALPPWLLTSAPPETPTDNLLRPSDAAGDERHPIRTAASLALPPRARRRHPL